MDYILSNANFYLSTCIQDVVGNAALNPNVKHSWCSDEHKPFLQWQHHRIWLVEKLQGCAHVKTTFAEFDLKEKTCYFIPAGTILQTSCIEGLMTQTHIEFLINSPVPPSFDKNSFSYESNEYELISLLMQKIKDNFVPNSFNDYTDSIIKIILSCFHLKSKLNDDVGQFIPVLEYVNENYAKKISVETLSALIGYTDTYFSTKFTALFGTTPNKFIENKRIERAKILLLASQSTISEITEKCGYSDIYYFSKRFKLATGYTPSKFRKLFKYRIDGDRN